jgi:hypothetical protein
VRIKIPDLAGATGGDTIASEAAMPCMSAPLLLLVGAGTGGVLSPDAVGEDLSSAVMVDCEEEREKVLARGARCVSLSSV